MKKRLVKIWNNGLKDVLAIIIGTTLMAIAVNTIYEPLNMVTGGFSGLAITLKKVLAATTKIELSVGLINFCLNIPVFIWAFFGKGKDFLLKTMFANIWFSFMMMILPIFPVAEKDFLLAAVVGGVLTGGGLGLVFSVGYSTGGTDLLSSLICNKFPFYAVSTMLFIFDTIIILSGILSFGIRIGCYAVISVFICSKVMDTILAGGKVGKQVLIISDFHQEIGQSIMNGLERGVTVIEATGMFSGKERPVLLCVVGKKEIVKVTRLVKAIDRKAFVIISETREVLGEGFNEKVE